MASRLPPGHACPALSGSVAFLSEKVVGETHSVKRESALWVQEGAPPGAGSWAPGGGSTCAPCGPWEGRTRPAVRLRQGRRAGSRLLGPGSRLTRPGPVC